MILLYVIFIEQMEYPKIKGAQKKLVNQPSKYQSKKMNLKLLTEVRQQFESSKATSTSFQIQPIFFSRKNKENNTISISSKKNLASMRALKQSTRKQGCVLSSSSAKFCGRTEIIKKQLFSFIEATSRVNKKNASGFTFDLQLNKLIKKLTTIFTTCESMLENLYHYKNVQKKIGEIIQITRLLSSKTLQFYITILLALVLFVYDSFSLTIYYLDRALKVYTNKSKYRFERRLEILAYQYASKIFVQRQEYENAKYLAYMFLRKAWFFCDHEEQLNAYDLLGIIELERGNLGLSKYFHHRMCKGALQSKQNNQKIMIMSNNQLIRNLQIKVDFYISQNITHFADKERQIIDIIEKHFKSEAQQHSVLYQGIKSKRICTHRSPNRNFKNYHILQRGMIEAKQSPEIHFIKAKNIKNIKKFINQISSFIFDLRKQIKMETIHHSLDQQLQIFQQETPLESSESQVLIDD